MFGALSKADCLVILCLSAYLISRIVISSQKLQQRTVGTSFMSVNSQTVLYPSMTICDVDAVSIDPGNFSDFPEPKKDFLSRIYFHDE